LTGGDVLIHRAVLIAPGTEKTIIQDGAVLIDKGSIRDIGTTPDLVERYPAEERLDALGLWLLPGFICAHARMSRSLARGMALPAPDMMSSGTRMAEFWQHYAEALDYEAIRYSALLACIEAIRFGTTLVFDLLSSPNATPFALDAMAEAVLQCGLRVNLSLMVSDYERSGGGRAAVDETTRFAGRIKSTPLLSASMGLDSCHLLSDATLGMAVGAAAVSRLGFHGLLGESQYARRECLTRYGLTPGARLRRWGVLSKRTLLAGAVYLDHEEQDIILRHGGWLVYNPRADMLSGLPLPPLEQYLQRGFSICLGSDGIAQDMLSELQAEYLLFRHAGESGQALSPGQSAGLLTRSNPAMAAATLGLPIGALAVGAPADLILLRPVNAAPLTLESLEAQLVLGSAGLEVDTMIVGGRILLRCGEFQTVDVAQVLANARTVTTDLWQRM
jgi:cytosine/adenosine deaminase-related metal-dependent hydrolase